MTYYIRHVKLTAKTRKVIMAMDKICFPGDAPVTPENTEWWIAYTSKGKPIGYAAIREYEPGSGFLARVGVLPAHRGRKLASRLLTARLAYAKRNKIHNVLTYTVHDNCGSINNIIRHGFTTYEPENAWVGTEVVYWRKTIQ